MSRYIVGQAGIIKNIVESPIAFTQTGFDVLLDVSGTANVGGSYDPKDVSFDAADQVSLKLLLRHENLLRELIRTVRSNATLNTQATAEALPTSANSADVTNQQFRDYVKTLLS